ncbi:hypothetical protein QQ045_033113 [Rhodiola kirilowii]
MNGCEYDSSLLEDTQDESESSRRSPLKDDNFVSPVKETFPGKVSQDREERGEVVVAKLSSSSAVGSVPICKASKDNLIMAKEINLVSKARRSEAGKKQTVIAQKEDTIENSEGDDSPEGVDSEEVKRRSSKKSNSDISGHEECGGRGIVSEEEKSRSSKKANSDFSGNEEQAAEVSLEKAVELAKSIGGTSCASLVRFDGKEAQDNAKGRVVSDSEGSYCSWGSTLQAFLEQKREASGRKKAKGRSIEQGRGLSVLLPVKESRFKDLEGVSGAVLGEKAEEDVGSIVGHFGKVQEASLMAKRKKIKKYADAHSPVMLHKLKEGLCNEIVIEDELIIEEDGISHEEVFFGRVENMKGASVKVGSLQLISKVDLPGGAHEEDRVASKSVKRRAAKEKRIVKSQERKSKAVLDRLKKSYVDELEKTEDKEEKKRKKERERRSLQRKEAEETYQMSLKLGIKGSLPEEEMIQLFENQLQRKYEERCSSLAER